MWRHWPLVVLVISVPLQYWISKCLFSSTSSSAAVPSPLPKSLTQGSSYYLQQTFASLDKKLKLQEWSRWPEKIVECAKRFLFDYIGSSEEDADEYEEEEEAPTTASEDGNSAAAKQAQDDAKDRKKAPDTTEKSTKRTVLVSKKKSADSEEMEAVEEVFDEKLHFAGSKEPRTPRHPDVDYRVGQAFKHKTHKYRGVIVGWDARPQVPVQVAKLIFKEHPERREQPFYAALIDTRNRVAPQLDYVSQDQINIIPGMTIVHPLINEYFQDRQPDPKTGSYILRPIFQEIYPED